MLHIAYIFPKDLYQTKMSPGRKMYGEAVDRLDDCKVTLTGPGWWKSNDIAKALPEIEKSHGKVDAIWCYKTDEVTGLRHVGIPRIFVFNEANNEEKTRADIADAAATHCVFHHYNDHITWSHRLVDEGISSSLQNHCAPGNPFADLAPWEQRPTKCLLTGVISFYVYPLRLKYEGLLRDRDLDGYGLPHPGYRIGGSSAIRSQYETYMVSLARAKIALCCTSRYKYPLAKLFEAAASGCVIATDKPECPIFEQALWPWCIQIDPTWDRKQIADHINSFSDETLKNYAYHTLRTAREVFTMEGWATKFTDTIRKKINE
jgi:hypothetical protein